MKMGIVTFTVESRVFKFKEPLMLETEYVEGGVCLTHQELGIFAHGASFSECEKIVREQLTELWAGFALEKDGVLTGSSLALKNKLLAMADEVK